MAPVGSIALPAQLWQAADRFGPLETPEALCSKRLNLEL